MIHADAAEHGELVDFLSTFQVAPGQTPLAVLAQAQEVMNAGGPEAVVERQVPIEELDGWRVTVDLYRPAEPGPWPAVLFVHGGAWTMGSPLTHDRLARELAAAGLLVASVDYPRAPRWPFPAGYDGCALALRWLWSSRSSLGCDGTIMVAGDSAGANLAAALAVTVPREEIPIDRAALLYGIYDVERALPTLLPLFGDAGQSYVAANRLAALRDDPRLNPEAAAPRFPPTWIGYGTGDPLAQESERLARALIGARVPIVTHPASQAPHSFLQLPFLDAYQAGISSLTAFLSPGQRPA